MLLALAAVPVGLRGDDLVDGVLDAVQGPRTAHGVHLESVSRVRAFSIGRRRGLTEPSPLYRFRTDEGPLELRMKGPMPRQHPEEVVMVDGGELRYYPRTGIWVPTGS